MAILLFSCKEENTLPDSAELWLKVDDSIEQLDILFAEENSKNNSQSYSIKYENGLFSSVVKKANDKNDGELWVLVHSSQEKCGQISFLYNNKEYKTRGFNNNEKRCIEIIKSVDGLVDIKNHDISIIEIIINVE